MMVVRDADGAISGGIGGTFAGMTTIELSVFPGGTNEGVLEAYRGRVAEIHGTGSEIAILIPETGSCPKAYSLSARHSDAASAWFSGERKISADRNGAPGCMRLVSHGLDVLELLDALARIYDGVVFLQSPASGTLYVVPPHMCPGKAYRSSWQLLDRPVAFRKDVFRDVVRETVPHRDGEEMFLYVGRSERVKFRNVGTLPDVFATRHPFLQVHVRHKSKKRFVLVWNTVAGAVQERFVSGSDGFATTLFDDAAVRLESPVVLPDVPGPEAFRSEPSRIVLYAMEALVRDVTGCDVTVLDAGLVRFDGRLRRPACALSPAESERFVHVAALARTGRTADRRGDGGRVSAPPPTVLVASELLSPLVDPRDRDEAVLHEAAHLVGGVTTSSSPHRGGAAVRTMRWACTCALMSLRLPSRGRLTGVDMVAMETDGDPDIEWWRARVGPEGSVAGVQTFLDRTAASYAGDSGDPGSFRRSVETMTAAMDVVLSGGCFPPRVRQAGSR